MATMVTSTRPPEIKKGSGVGPGLPGPNGNGSKRGGSFRDPESHANRYRIGMWVALASVTMMSPAPLIVAPDATAPDLTGAVACSIDNPECEACQ